jgi:hypothetical protein
MRLFKGQPMWPTLVIAGLLLAGAMPLEPSPAAASVPATARQAPAAVEAPVVPQVAEGLRRLARLLASISSEAPDIIRPRDRARVTLGSLLELSASWPAESPMPYRRNVATLAATVGEALAEPSRRALPSVLEALADDLEAKLEHCQASGGKLGGAVRVLVRTRDPRQEVRDWQVLYLPKIQEASPSATPGVFPELSSPTNEQLVPGRYVLWARNPFTGQSGDRQIFKVGEGRAGLTLELPVPAARP